MEQQKIGAFIKTLRNEKGITQEQLAEKVGVSNRTVSRWETGRNLPDFDVLIELSEIFGVGLREILDGERKSEQMNKDTEATALKAVAYTSNEAQRNSRRVRAFDGAALVLFAVSMLLRETSFAQNTALLHAGDFAQGAAVGLLLVSLVLSSKYGLKIRAFKQRLLAKGENGAGN